jgi:hypothetical protein
MNQPRLASLVAVLALLMTTACAGAQQATPAPVETVTARRTPSTSSAQVTIEESDAGIEAVRDLRTAIADGDTAAAWSLLGPRTRGAVGSRSGLPDLGAALAPLVRDRTATFDDVIVAQTSRDRTHLVVLDHADTAKPVVGAVTITGGRRVIELSPPTPSDVEFTVTDRQRIEIATPLARNVELVVDGFHFHPTVGTGGDPSVMTIPYPLSNRSHVLGAWYRTDGGVTGLGSTVVPAEGSGRTGGWRGHRRRRVNSQCTSTTLPSATDSSHVKMRWVNAPAAIWSRTPDPTLARSTRR